MLLEKKMLGKKHCIWVLTEFPCNLSVNPKA